MACAGVFRSVVEQGFLYLFLPAAPVSAILSWSSALHSRRGCRRARSQRTIKKSTKNKLRSAYPSPFRARFSFSRHKGSSTPCHPRVATSRQCVGANAALFHPLFPSLSVPSSSLPLSFFLSFSLFLRCAFSPRFSPPPRPHRRCRFSSLFFLVVYLG